MAAPTRSAPAAGLDGLTWFLRCAACHTLYMATEALVFNQEGNTLHLEVLWARPPRRRKPTPCTHLGAIERWDGTTWVLAEARTKEQP